MNYGARSCNHCCRVMGMGIEYSECVSVALVGSMKIASSVCRIIFLSVACLVVPYLSTLSHKRHNFLKRNY
jgi:hypothetical protein